MLGSDPEEDPVPLRNANEGKIPMVISVIVHYESAAWQPLLVLKIPQVLIGPA